MSIPTAQSFGFSPSLHQDPHEMRPGAGRVILNSSSSTARAGIFTSAATQGEKEVERAVDVGLRTFGEASRFQWLAWQQQQQDASSVGDGGGGGAPTAGGGEQNAAANINNANNVVVLAGAEGSSQMRLSVASHEPGTPEQEQKKREWRAAQQHRTKTLHFLLLLNLNQGMDPPDYTRIEPYAKLQCWCDPQVAQAKMVQGSDAIGEALEAQYKTVQKEGVYKRLMEAHVDDARVAMISARRRAKDGRLLLHYNGHGTPKATAQGELWFFNRDHTHYIPMPVKDITTHCGSPSLYVLDCNGAGGVLSAWKNSMTPDQLANNRDIWLCACSEGGYLPSNPKLPADLLTSCLTTPVRMALVWYIYYSHRTLLLPDVTPDMVRNIPGDLTNRKTMLGEIHWILTAVTDTIAWSVLPKMQFFSVFRTDPIVVKSLFRNFLLADKILRELDCTPVSHPPLPADTHLHAMWSTWEVTLESLLCQLPQLLDPATLKPKPNAEYKPTTFFHDQLTAFEVWLDVGNTATRPQQLPCLVLGLIQTSYRVRSLLLLCRYLDIQHREVAVTHSLYCGAIPYLSKLVSTNYLEVSSLLVVVWMQLMGVDPDFSCMELIRNQAWRPFMKILQLTPKTVSMVNASAEQGIGVGSGGAAGGAQAGGGAGMGQAEASSTVTGTQQRMGSSIQLGASLPVNSDGPMLGTTLIQGGGPVNNSTNNSAGGGGDSALGTPTTMATPHSRAGSEPHGSPNPQGSGSGSSTQKLYSMEGFSIHRYRAVTAYLMVELLERGGEQVWTWVWNNSLITITYQMLTDPNSDGFSSSSHNSNSSNGVGGGSALGRGGANSPSPHRGSIGGSQNATGSSLGGVMHAAAGSSYQGTTSASSAGVLSGMSPTAAASIPSAPGQGAGLRGTSSNDQHGALMARDGKLLQTWACLLQAKMLSCLTSAKQHAAMVCFGAKHQVLSKLLADHNPSLRSATVCLLGSYIGTRLDLLNDKESALKRVDVDARILKLLISAHNDPSSEVRKEVLIAVCQYLYWYSAPTQTNMEEEGIIRTAGLEVDAEGEEGGQASPQSMGGAGGPGQQQASGMGHEANYGFTIPQIDRGVQTQLRAGPAVLDGNSQIGANAAAAAAAANLHNGNGHNSPGGDGQPQQGGGGGNEDTPPYLTRNDILPSPTASSSKPWNVNSPAMGGGSGGSVLNVIKNIVHDACVVLARYLMHHDSALVRDTVECLKILRQRQQPLSQRLHVEAKRSMRGLGNLGSSSSDSMSSGAASSVDMAEEEKVQERRNVTRMRQSVLSTMHRTYTPHSNNLLASTAGNLGNTTTSTTTTHSGTSAKSAVPARRNRVVAVPRSQVAKSSSTAAPTAAAPASPATAYGSDYVAPYGDDSGPGAVGSSGTRAWTTHALPLTALEEVTAAQFRLLEPQVIHGDKFGRVSLSSFAALECISIVDQLTHEGGGKIQQLHLVNDLTSSPLACLCDVWGTFALYPLYPDGSGILNPVGTPTGQIVGTGGSGPFTGGGAGGGQGGTNFIGQHGLGQATQYRPRSAVMTMPQSSVLHPIDTAHHRVPTRVISEYRPKDSSLFFSPCSSKIGWVSIEYQQLIASESLFSGAAITAISVDKSEKWSGGSSSGPSSTSSASNSSGARVFVGTSDGMVIGLDDRSGKLSKVSDWNNNESRSSSSSSKYGGGGKVGGGAGGGGTNPAHQAIVHMGSLKDHYLYVANGATMKVYDQRKTSGRSGTVYEFDLLSTTRDPGQGSSSNIIGGGGGGPGPAHAGAHGLEDTVGGPGGGGGGGGVARPPPMGVASVAVGRMVPLWCSVSQDGLVDMFTPKGESLFPAAVAPAGAGGGLGAPEKPERERSGSNLEAPSAGGAGDRRDAGTPSGTHVAAATSGGGGGGSSGGGSAGGKPKVSVFSQEAVCCMHPTKPMVLSGTEIVVYQGA